MPGMNARPGEIWGPFRIERTLGRGGMGAVFLALDLQVGRRVALKVILNEDRNPTRQERFAREGELTAALTHPGIVRVHSAGVVGRVPYLAYELVEGARPLNEAWRHAGIRERVGWLRDAARALGYAHQQGVVHRDVKPDNLLVDAEGKLRVADFGLAAGQGVERLTRTGALLGTPHYMAPEQVLGSSSLAESDVWALGVILYEAITDKLPFTGSNQIELLVRVREARWTPPSSITPQLSPALERVCRRAMARDPERRYSDASELARDLEAWLEGEEVPRGPKRWLPLSLGLTALILLMGGIAQWGSRPLHSGPAPNVSASPGPSARPTLDAQARAAESAARGGMRDVRSATGRAQVRAADEWLQRFASTSLAPKVRAIRRRARATYPLAQLECDYTQALFLTDDCALAWGELESTSALWDLSLEVPAEVQTAPSERSLAFTTYEAASFGPERALAWTDQGFQLLSARSPPQVLEVDRDYPKQLRIGARQVGSTCWVVTASVRSPPGHPPALYRLQGSRLVRVREFSWGAGREYDVHEVSISSDGRYVAFATGAAKVGGGVRVYDATSGELRWKHETALVYALVCDPQKPVLAASSRTRELFLFNTGGDSSEHLTARVNTIKDQLRLPGLLTLAITPDGRHLLAGSQTGGKRDLHTFRLPSGDALERRDLRSSPSTLAISPNGRRLLVAYATGGLEEWTLELPLQ
jgi:hypothetical protein